MTPLEPGSPETRNPAAPSLLPLEVADLMKLRVRPAQFARMAAVTKQTVSQWIKKGVVTLGPDGRLDPEIAAGEVISRTDPARLRARFFKSATATQDDLRRRVAELEQDLRDEIEFRHAREQAVEFRLMDETDRKLMRLQSVLMARFNEFVEANANGGLYRWLDELVAVEFYGADLEIYRKELQEDAGELANAYAAQAVAAPAALCANSSENESPDSRQ